MSGLDRFSHLEDKIYRAVELCKSLRLEKEGVDKELASARQQIADLTAEVEKLKGQVERLVEDRAAMKFKVEGMLDAIAMLEMEADSLKK